MSATRVNWEIGHRLDDSRRGGDTVPESLGDTVHDSSRKPQGYASYDNRSGSFVDIKTMPLSSGVKLGRHLTCRGLQLVGIGKLPVFVIPEGRDIPMQSGCLQVTITDIIASPSHLPLVGNPLSGSGTRSFSCSIRAYCILEWRSSLHLPRQTVPRAPRLRQHWMRWSGN